VSFGWLFHISLGVKNLQNEFRKIFFFLGIVIALTGSMEETNVGEDLNLKRKTVLHQNAQSIVS
jgi:hypothetical protein